MTGKFVKLIVFNNCVKFCYPRLNHSREIRSEGISEGIFDSFFRDNFWPVVDSDVISGVIVDQTGMDVPVKFGDPRSNRSRDIRAAYFVMEDEWRRTQVIT